VSQLRPISTWTYILETYRRKVIQPQIAQINTGYQSPLQCLLSGSNQGNLLFNRPFGAPLCFRRARWAPASVTHSTHSGEVDGEGDLDKVAVKAQMNRAATKLIARFPDPRLQQITPIEMKENLRNADGTTVIESLPPWELVLPRLLEVGFEIIELEFMPDAEPFQDYCWQVTAMKPS